MKSIIFDLDGTLWDSSESVAESWNATLRRLGLSLPSGELTAGDLKSGMGMTMTGLAEKYFPMLNNRRRTEVLEICMREENAYIAKNGGKLFGGEEETLEKLRRGSRLFIVSNCQKGYIEAFFSYTGFERFFEGHMCWGDTGREKSYTISALVKDFRCTDPVYVGDTQGDCLSAYEAGVPFVHAAYGFGAVSTPERVWASAPSFSALTDIFA